MNIMYYVLSAVLMGICFCVGVLTEKHFADKEIEMLKTRKVRPARIKIERRVHVTKYSVSDPKHLDIDYPNNEKVG